MLGVHKYEITSTRLLVSVECLRWHHVSAHLWSPGAWWGGTGLRASPMESNCLGAHLPPRSTIWASQRSVSHLICDMESSSFLPGRDPEDMTSLCKNWVHVSFITMGQSGIYLIEDHSPCPSCSYSSAKNGQAKIQSPPLPLSRSRLQYQPSSAGPEPLPSAPSSVGIHSLIQIHGYF